MTATEALIPLAAIFCIFGLPILAFVFFRVMAHRERMAMINSGLLPGGLPPRDWRAAGAARPGGRFAPGASCSDADNAQTTLRKGITLTFIGFALTTGLSFIGFHDDTMTPGPWLLGGLIPMFVGIAQVVIALLSGATLRPGFRVPPPASFSDAPDAPPPAAPVYDGSYTYRPGGTQELRPPSAPPERRS